MNAESRDVAQADAPDVVNPFANAPVAAAPTGASAQALVQREVAEVQAAMVIAKRFPRDPIAAMDRILASCARPTLAQSGLYQYSRGGSDITGPSIRLAEELGRQWGNVVCGVTELSRGNGISEALAYAWDLETNFRDEKRFQVRHWRDTRSGGHAIKDERDIYEHIANMGARRKRACLLAIIPSDVQEAAVKQCEQTLNTNIEFSPERVKRMVATFESEFKVTQTMIEKRIQRRIDSMTPALMVQLSRIYNSLRDGMSNPGDWFEVDQDASSGGDGGKQQAGTQVGKVKEQLRGRAGAAAAARLPQFDEASAVKAIKTCETLKQLEGLAEDVRTDFVETKREVPPAVTAAIDDRRAAIEQKGKPS